MNREILFHGKRIDNGEWVEGCLLKDYITGQYFIHTYGNSVNESDKVDEEGSLKFFAFEVFPETVCQYTGLSDKNGRKIFEGDIVRVVNIDRDNQVFDIGYISFEEGAWFLCGEMLCWFDNVISFEFEVIGNVFDNPELIN